MSNPSRTEILAGVAAVAREHLGFEGELRPDLRLVDALRLDSLRRLTLAVEVENRFRVRLEPEDEAAIDTVGDLVAAVGRKLAAPGGELG
ncbi:MAG: acyl carrier protein [Acidobacteriota bacterium]